MIRAIDAGAMGFVPKQSSNDTLFEALRMVMNGGIYVPPMMLGGLAPVLPQPPQPDGDTVPDVMRARTADSGFGDLARHVAGDEHPAAPDSFASLGLSPRQPTCWAICSRACRTS